jgi:hypothetical protein
VSLQRRFVSPSCVKAFIVAAAILAILPQPARAGRIERILWNAIRFQQQAEFLQDISEAAQLPLSAVDLRYNFDDFPRGNTMSLSPGVQWGFSAEDFFYVEVPYLIADWDDAGPKAGFGDVLLEYQRVLTLDGLDDEDTPISGLIASLDLTAPTGDEQRNIGEGAWVILPALTGLFQIGEDTTIAPTIAYLHSFGPVRERSLSVGAARGEAIKANARLLLVAPNLIHNIGDKGWLLFSPDYTYDFDSNASTWDLRAGFGIQFTEDTGVNLQYSQHLGGEVLLNRSLSVIFSYFF